jgi:hypothetical protein
MHVQKFILWTALVLAVTFQTWADEVQVELKTRATENNSHRFYIVTSGDIDGQATATSVSSLNSAQSIVNAEIVGVKSTFNNANAPYGGHITKTIQCFTHKYVTEKNIDFAGEKTQVVLAVASSRRIFGICTADEVKFASGVWAAYDKSKSRVLSVKLFKPVTNPTQIAKAQEDILLTLSKTITHL